MKYGYKDTDKEIKIDLYDLEFVIKDLDGKKIEELKKIDKDLTSTEKEIEEILGEGSVKKINDKREADGYPKMDLNVQLAVLGCIFDAYGKAMSDNVIGKVEGTINNINNRINNFGNRTQRRNNKYRRY